MQLIIQLMFHCMKIPISIINRSYIFTTKNNKKTYKKTSLKVVAPEKKAVTANIITNVNVPRILIQICLFSFFLILSLYCGKDSTLLLISTGNDIICPTGFLASGSNIPIENNIQKIILSIINNI